MKSKRENIEWLNTWISGANTDGKRILLVGDSVTRLLRSSLEKYLNGLYLVDLYAASYRLTDERLVPSVMDFLHGNEYTYEYVIINYGFHHGYSETVSNQNEDNAPYKALKELIAIFTGICSRVVLMNGTDYIVKDRDIVGQAAYKSELELRNEVYRKLSEELNLEYVDINSFITTDSAIWMYIDPVHPDKVGMSAMAYYVPTQIEGMVSPEVQKKMYAILEEDIGKKAAELVSGGKIKSHRGLKFKIIMRKHINRFLIYVEIAARKSLSSIRIKN